MLEPQTEDLQRQKEVAEKIASGEYFRDARNWYSFMAHDPMAERYFFLLIAGLAILTSLLAFVSMRLLYPLSVSVPFIINTHDIVEDLPRMNPLALPAEDPDMAIQRHLATNYVILREEYDLALLERNTSGVKAHSAPELFDSYQRTLDPRNPDSFVVLYQRHSTRKVSFVSYKPPEEEGGEAELVFDAVVESPTDRKKTRWVANIAFRATKIALDEKTGKPVPLEFVVTKYQSKRIQDSAS